MPIWEIKDNYSGKGVEIFIGSHDAVWNYIKAQWGVGYGIKSLGRTDSEHSNYENIGLNVVRG